MWTWQAYGGLAALAYASESLGVYVAARAAPAAGEVALTVAQFGVRAVILAVGSAVMDADIWGLIGHMLRATPGLLLLQVTADIATVAFYTAAVMKTAEKGLNPGLAAAATLAAEILAAIVIEGVIFNKRIGILGSLALAFTVASAYIATLGPAPDKEKAKAARVVGTASGQDGLGWRGFAALAGVMLAITIAASHYADIMAFASHRRRAAVAFATAAVASLLGAPLLAHASAKPQPPAALAGAGDLLRSPTALLCTAVAGIGSLAGFSLSLDSIILAPHVVFVAALSSCDTLIVTLISRVLFGTPTNPWTLLAAFTMTLSAAFLGVAG